MKISVVIPAHNEEKNIASTIEAVLAQDYPDFEIIVVDNASVDRTSEEAMKFPVQVVREDRKGLLWARECGRLSSSGDIIANIDADCLPDSNWLTTGAKHFENKNVVAASGPYDYYDTDKFFRNSSLFIQKHIYRATGHLLQLPFIKKGAVLIGGNNFIRAETIEKAGGYNTDLVFYGEDTDTAKRVAHHGRVVFDPKLIMKTSGRRFKDEGTLATFGRYLFHFVKTIFSK